MSPDASNLITGELQEDKEETMKRKSVLFLVRGSCLVSVVAILLLGNLIVSSSSVLQEDTIRIGATVSLTGSYEREGLSLRRGYELWEEEINEKGGLLGRYVELVLYDDRSNPDEAIAKYIELVEVDGVDLLLGPYGTEISRAVSDLPQKYMISMILPGTAASDIFEAGYEYIFQVLAPDKTYFEYAVDIAEKQDIGTVAIICADTDFMRAATAAAAEKLAERGIVVVHYEEYPRETSDFVSLLGTIQELQPDAVFGGTYLQDAILITRQIRELDIEVDMLLLTEASAQEYFDVLGEDAEGVYGLVQWDPRMKGEADIEFVEAFTNTYDIAPDYIAAAGYAAGQIAESAAYAAYIGRSLDSVAINEALLTMHTSTVIGSYMVLGEPWEGLQVGHSAYLAEWVEGQLGTAPYWGKIHGKVLEDDHGCTGGVQRATVGVQASPAGTWTKDVTRTNVFCYYELGSLKPGWYPVTAEQWGYDMRTQTVYVYGGQSTKVYFYLTRVQ